LALKLGAVKLLPLDVGLPNFRVEEEDGAPWIELDVECVERGEEGLGGEDGEEKEV